MVCALGSDFQEAEGEKWRRDIACEMEKKL